MIVTQTYSLMIITKLFQKSRMLHQKYDPLCEKFIVTFHPKGLQGDIPGKCSNFNYAARMAVKQLRADKVIERFTSENVTFTKNPGVHINLIDDGSSTLLVSKHMSEPVM